MCDLINAHIPAPSEKSNNFINTIISSSFMACQHRENKVILQKCIFNIFAILHTRKSSQSCMMMVCGSSQKQYFNKYGINLNEKYKYQHCNTTKSFNLHCGGYWSPVVVLCPPTGATVGKTIHSCWLLHRTVRMTASNNGGGCYLMLRVMTQSHWI